MPGEDIGGAYGTLIYPDDEVWTGKLTHTSAQALDKWLVQFDNPANVAASLMRKSGDAVVDYLRREKARR